MYNCILNSIQLFFILTIIYILLIYLRRLYHYCNFMKYGGVPKKHTSRYSSFRNNRYSSSYSSSNRSGRVTEKDFYDSIRKKSIDLVNSMDNNTKEIISNNTNITIIVLPYGHLKDSDTKRPTQLDLILELFKEYMKNNDNIYVIVSEQLRGKDEDGHPQKFNRGILLNIAIKYFKDNIKNPDTIVLHDIDFLPNPHLFLKYLERYDSQSLIPQKSKEFKKAYEYTNKDGTIGYEPMFTGSAIYATNFDDFVAANGFPNKYWGWGAEDNALDIRYKNVKGDTYELNLNLDEEDDIISSDMERTSGKSSKEKSLRNNNAGNDERYYYEAYEIEWKNEGYLQLNEDYYTIENMEELELEQKNEKPSHIIHIKSKLKNVKMILTSAQEKKKEEIIQKYKKEKKEAEIETETYTWRR